MKLQFIGDLLKAFFIISETDPALKKDILDFIGQSRDDVDSNRANPRLYSGQVHPPLAEFQFEPYYHPRSIIPRAYRSEGRYGLGNYNRGHTTPHDLFDLRSLLEFDPDLIRPDIDINQLPVDPL